MQPTLRSFSRSRFLVFSRLLLTDALEGQNQNARHTQLPSVRSLKASRARRVWVGRVIGVRRCPTRIHSSSELEDKDVNVTAMRGGVGRRSRASGRKHIRRARVDVDVPVAFA